MIIGAGLLLGERYVLLTRIATGGMGEVWRARDRATGQMVAAKVLRDELCGKAHFLARLRLEARNAMRVHHPNLAAVLDHGEEAGTGWIVMELVEGRPLSEMLEGGAVLEPKTLLPMLVQVSAALTEVHRSGIIHRDIKPANLLVRSDGVVKLTDFGISLADDQKTMTQVGMVMGTAQYLPPEQAMGRAATPAGDLYALGVIAYEALAGHRPFTGASQVDIAFAHVNRKVPPMPMDVPEPLRKLVMRLLSKVPEKRPASATELVELLLTVGDELGIDARPPAQISPKLPARMGVAVAEIDTAAPIVAPAQSKPVTTQKPKEANSGPTSRITTTPAADPLPQVAALASDLTPIPEQKTAAPPGAQAIPAPIFAAESAAPEAALAPHPEAEQPVPFTRSASDSAAAEGAAKPKHRNIPPPVAQPIAPKPSVARNDANTATESVENTEAGETAAEAGDKILPRQHFTTDGIALFPTAPPTPPAGIRSLGGAAKTPRGFWDQFLDFWAAWNSPNYTPRHRTAQVPANERGELAMPLRTWYGVTAWLGHSALRQALFFAIFFLLMTMIFALALAPGASSAGILAIPMLFSRRELTILETFSGERIPEVNKW